MVESPSHTVHSSSDTSEQLSDPLSPVTQANSNKNGLTKEMLIKRDSLLCLDEEARLTLHQEI